MNIEFLDEARLEFLDAISAYEAGLIGLAPRRPQVNNDSMKTSVDLDDELAAEVERTGTLIHEKPDTVLRLAIQAGLPLLVSRSEPPRPEGYFTNDYPLPAEWLELETAMAKTNQGPGKSR